METGGYDNLPSFELSDAQKENLQVDNTVTGIIDESSNSNIEAEPVPSMELMETQIVEKPAKEVFNLAKGDICVSDMGSGGNTSELANVIKSERVLPVVVVDFKEVAVEKVVEVPEVRTNVIVKEVEVPLLVEVPIVQPIHRPIEVPVKRNVPVPVDVTTTMTYKMPQIKPKYTEVPVPIYVPRYIEVPVPAQFKTRDSESRRTSLCSQLSSLRVGEQYQDRGVCGNELLAEASRLSSHSSLQIQGNGISTLSRLQSQNSSLQQSRPVSRQSTVSQTVSRNISGVGRRPSSVRSLGGHTSRDGAVPLDMLQASSLTSVA